MNAWRSALIGASVAGEVVDGKGIGLGFEQPVALRHAAGPPLIRLHAGFRVLRRGVRQAWGQLLRRVVQNVGLLSHPS